MAEKMKNMSVADDVLVRLVELKKGYGLRSLSAVINYLLDLVDPVDRAVISQRIELQKEYQAALKACKELRELVSQPIQPAYETKPLRAVMTVDMDLFRNRKLK